MPTLWWSATATTAAALGGVHHSPWRISFEYCRQVEARLTEITDPAALYDVKAKLAAFDEYLAATSKDGRAQMAATMRRLEVRIGVVIGAAKLDHDRHPGATSLANDVAELTRNERSQFRRMADHPEIVEQVIADSADSNPPSRRVGRRCSSRPDSPTS